MAQGVIEQLSLQFGISVWILVVIVVWSAVWKLLALWKSARKKHIAWFIILALINTIGILEILYIYVFSDMKMKVEKKEAPKRKSRRKRRR